MGFYEHTTEFAGLPVADWNPEAGKGMPTVRGRPEVKKPGG